MTVGGLGCTLDDLTMQGIAAAFNVSLIFNQQLYDLLCVAESNVNLNSENCVSSLRRMAHVPSIAILHLDKNEPGSKYPVISCENVFVLPGPPCAVMNQFKILQHLFQVTGEEKFYQSYSWIKEDEKELAVYLKAFLIENTGVEIGCYPSGSMTQVKLQFSFYSLNGSSNN